MKLVELLARELAAWPAGLLGNDGITQDRTGEINTLDSGCIPKFYEGDGVWLASSHSFLEGYEPMKRASDYKTAIVTREMWQAERDRQKGGEWKRHRGGKCPVPVGTKVSTRHRDGKVADVHFHTSMAGSGPATMNAIWKHTGDGHDIMAYKIISQPQAEGVEVGSEKKWYEPEEAPDTRGHKGPFPCAPESEPLKQLEWDIQFPSGVCSVQAKTEQMETPFKWRDEVTELNAYIEKYTRERDALIERLASEGFALIPPVVSVVSEFYGVDMSDWRNWKAGDIVVCAENYSKQFTQGKKYELSGLDNDERYPRVQIKSDDMGEVNGWGAERFKFHSRP